MGSRLVLQLAWRNIWRHPRRTLLTALAIGFTTTILVFFIGIQYSSYDTAINATVGLFHGHMQVQHRAYLDDPSVRTTIPEPQALAEQIVSKTSAAAVSVRGIAFALAATESRSYGVQVVGVLPESERRVSTVGGVVKSGTYLSDVSAQELVVGELLARNLNVEMGDEVTLLGQGSDGSMAATVLPVVGVFRTGSAELDRSMVQMPLAVFQEVYSMGSDAHTVVVHAPSLDAVPALQREIRALIAADDQQDPKVVRLWTELLPGLQQSIELDMASGWLFYLSLVLVVTFTILNTFLMSVLERTREFGVMLALGITPFRLGALIALEAVLLTLLGIAGGVAVGCSLLWYFGVHGFTVPGSEEVMKLWNLSGAVYPEITVAVLTVGPLVVAAAGLFSVVFPIVKIARLRPVEALRQ